MALMSVINALNLLDDAVMSVILALPVVLKPCVPGRKFTAPSKLAMAVPLYDSSNSDRPRSKETTLALYVVRAFDWNVLFDATTDDTTTIKSLKPPIVILVLRVIGIR